MTSFTVELVVTDNRFINDTAIEAYGSNTLRRTIYKGKAQDDELALSEAEVICGPLNDGGLGVCTDIIGRKYRTWVRQHKLHSEYKCSSALVVTFKTELS